MAIIYNQEKLAARVRPENRASLEWVKYIFAARLRRELQSRD
jgi:hypothetical protein